MSSTHNHQRGFGIIAILTLIIVVTIISIAGFGVYKNQHKTNAMTTTTPSATSPTTPVQSPTEQPSQPVEMLLSHYKSSKYTGIAFDYPKEWIVNELLNDKSTGPVPVEFSITTSINSDEKYKTTALLEVIDKDYSSVASYYYSTYTQSNSLKVDKSETALQTKKVTHFVNTSSSDPTNPTRFEQYLIDVNGKTYSLSSINEELNVQRDNAYWQKFDKLFETLKIE